MTMNKLKIISHYTEFETKCLEIGRWYPSHATQIIREDIRNIHDINNIGEELPYQKNCVRKLKRMFRVF